LPVSSARISTTGERRAGVVSCWNVSAGGHLPSGGRNSYICGRRRWLLCFPPHCSHFLLQFCKFPFHIRQVLIHFGASLCHCCPDVSFHDFLCSRDPPVVLRHHLYPQLAVRSPRCVPARPSIACLLLPRKWRIYSDVSLRTLTFREDSEEFGAALRQSSEGHVASGPLYGHRANLGGYCEMATSSSINS
jgi:hypothetical protein